MFQLKAFLFPQKKQVVITVCNTLNNYGCAVIWGGRQRETETQGERKTGDGRGAETERPAGRSHFLEWSPETGLRTTRDVT